MTRRKRNRRAKRPPHHPQQANPARPYRVGIVAVHGVGDHALGATAGQVANRIETTLQELGVGLHNRVPENEGAVETEIPGLSEREIAFPNDRPVLIAEAYWADLVREQREPGWRAAASRLWFVMKFLPYLIAAALAPRSSEIAAGAHRDNQRPRAELDEFVEQAPMVWRGITMVTLGLVVLSTFVMWPKWALLFIPLLVVGALIFLRTRLDVVEHVRIAGLGRAGLSPIVARVGGVLDHVAYRCDEVWVIGHSQGGYIAHRLLSEEADAAAKRWPTVRHYTGVASGLRPISLIHAVKGWQWIVGGWVWQVGVVVFFCGMLLMFEQGGPLNTVGSRMFVQVVLFGLVDYFRVAADFSQSLATQGDSPVFLELLTESTSWELYIPTQWGWLTVLLLAASLFTTGVLLQQRGGGTVPKISSLPAHIRWEEITSPSDLVGSMSIPEINGSPDERSVPSLRRPIRDHFLSSYLGNRSVFRFELAQWAAPDSERSQRFRGLASCTASLSTLSDRAYKLRMTVQLLFLAFAVVLPTAFGAPLLAVVSAMLLAGITLAAVTTMVAGSWWLILSRRIIRAFVRHARSSSATGAAKVATNARSRRTRFAQCATLVAAVVSTFSGWGCYLYALFVSTANDSDLNGVVFALQRASSSLMAAVILILLAFCLSVIEVRGVRAALMLSAFGLLASIQPFLQAGDAWQSQLYPGLAPVALTIVCVLVSLILNRLKPTSSQRNRAPEISKST